MADTLVLAELSIDSSGVVRGMAVVDKTLDQGTKQLNKFGNEGEKTAKKTDLLSARMFNLKNALTAALGGFTLAGGILAIKNLGEQAIRAQENFGVFDKALGRAQTSLFRVLGDVTGLNKTLGDTAVILDAVGRGLETIRGKSTGTTGLLWKALWGTTSVGQIQNILDKAARLIESANAGGALGPAYGGEGEVVEGTVLPPRTFPEPGAPFGPPAPPGANTSYFRAGSPYAAQAIKIDVPPNLSDPVRDLANTFDAALIAARNLGGYIGSGRNGMQENGETLPSIFEAFGEVYVEDLTGQFVKMRTAVDDASDAYENFGTIAEAAMTAVSAAAAAGVVSATAAARVQEALLAVDAILRGKIEVAKAVAAAASGNYGSAALHGVAAGLYFSAAAFHGVAAVSSSSAYSSVAGRGRASDSPNVLQDDRSSRPAPNITINLQGSYLGTSPEKVARDFVALWQKGARDMGGGAAVVAAA